jgi:formiminoglutamate deiminase
VRYFAEKAWLPAGPADRVLLEVTAGRFTRVTPGADPAGARRLPGVVLPGFANAHSHAFHRALRGQAAGTDFWTWRAGMYALAGRLDPDTYHRLARATYAEMALAGVTAVGEFHYLHHGPGGVPYADPNAMGHALAAAARDAGIRLTLLDTCYLTGGFGRPLEPGQRRFSDGTADAWAARVSSLRDGPGLRIGAAIHSVRAVPASSFGVFRDRLLHVHLSEQPAENAACLAHHGVTPTRLLHDGGVLGERTTAVHATHLTPGDIALLNDSGTTVCPCPTTEQDLADGLGPMGDLRGPLALGTDQHAVIDPLTEARLLEMHERLRTGRRGTFAPAALVAALTNHACLGWPDAGRLDVGARADLVAVRTDTPRTAGTDVTQLPLVATAADIHTVVVDGAEIVTAGRHATLDVPAELAGALRATG